MPLFERMDLQTVENRRIQIHLWGGGLRPGTRRPHQSPEVWLTCTTTSASSVWPGINRRLASPCEGRWSSTRQTGEFPR